MSKKASKHSHTVKCRNYLHVGVCSKNASMSGFACRPFGVRGTMFVGSGAVTLEQSCECDITSFVKGLPESAQQLRDSTVAACRGRESP